MFSFRPSLLSLTRSALLPTRVFRPFLQTATMASRRASREAQLELDDEDVIEQAVARETKDRDMEGATEILERHTGDSSRIFEAGRKRESERKLKKLREVSFIKPSYWSEDGKPRRQQKRKRSLLGPSAPESRARDAFYQLDVDPLYEATNPRLMSYFVTDMGKVKSRADTKLTWYSQRRLSKAIRRAKMMGIMPILSKEIPAGGYRSR